MVPGGFPWYFMASGWFIMVPGGILWFFIVPAWFFMVSGRFSLFQVGFHGSRSVFMVPCRFSWFQVGFHVSRSVFIVPGRFSWFFMVPGGFYGFLRFQVCFSWLLVIDVIGSREGINAFI